MHEGSGAMSALQQAHSVSQRWQGAAANDDEIQLQHTCMLGTGRRPKTAELHRLQRLAPCALVL